MNTKECLLLYLPSLLTWNDCIFRMLDPRPEGCGRMNPCIWKRDPDDAWDGFNSIYPHIHREVTIKTRFLMDSWDSTELSFSSLQYKIYPSKSIMTISTETKKLRKNNPKFPLFPLEWVS